MTFYIEVTSDLQNKILALLKMRIWKFIHPFIIFCFIQVWITIHRNKKYINELDVKVSLKQFVSLFHFALNSVSIILVILTPSFLVLLLFTLYYFCLTHTNIQTQLSVTMTAVAITFVCHEFPNNQTRGERLWWSNCWHRPQLCVMAAMCLERVC